MVQYICMEIIFRSKDYELTDDVRNYAEEHLQAVEKHLGSAASGARCEVELGKDHSKSGDVYFADISVSVPGTEGAKATATASSVNAAIDQVKDDLLSQFRSRKKLHSRMLKKGGALLKRILRGE